MLDKNDYLKKFGLKNIDASAGVANYFLLLCLLFVGIELLIILVLGIAVKCEIQLYFLPKFVGSLLDYMPFVSAISGVLFSISFYVWIYRLSANFHAMDLEKMRYSPAQAVYFFFVPILNFYMPYRVLEELWKFKAFKGAISLFRSWWASHIIYIIASMLLFPMLKGFEKSGSPLLMLLCLFIVNVVALNYFVMSSRVIRAFVKKHDLLIKHCKDEGIFLEKERMIEEKESELKDRIPIVEKNEEPENTKKYIESVPALRMQRIKAGLIDFIVILPILFLTDYFLKRQSLFFISLLGLFVLLFYKPWLEFFKKQTFGKKALGLKINSKQGSFSFAKVFVRSLPLYFLIVTSYTFMLFYNICVWSKFSFRLRSRSIWGFIQENIDNNPLFQVMLLLFIVSVILFYVDLLMISFSKRRRALHDIISDTSCVVERLVRLELDFFEKERQCVSCEGFIPAQFRVCPGCGFAYLEPSNVYDGMGDASAVASQIDYVPVAFSKRLTVLLIDLVTLSPLIFFFVPCMVFSPYLAMILFSLILLYFPIMILMYGNTVGGASQSFVYLNSSKEKPSFQQAILRHMSTIVFCALSMFLFFSYLKYLHRPIDIFLREYRIQTIAFLILLLFFPIDNLVALFNSKRKTLKGLISRTGFFLEEEVLGLVDDKEDPEDQEMEGGFEEPTISSNDNLQEVKFSEDEPKSAISLENEDAQWTLEQKESSQLDDDFIPIASSNRIELPEETFEEGSDREDVGQLEAELMLDTPLMKNDEAGGEIQLAYESDFKDDEELALSTTVPSEPSFIEHQNYGESKHRKYLKADQIECLEESGVLDFEKDEMVENILKLKKIEDPDVSDERFVGNIADIELQGQLCILKRSKKLLRLLKFTKIVSLAFALTCSIVSLGWYFLHGKNSLITETLKLKTNQEVRFETAITSSVLGLKSMPGHTRDYINRGSKKLYFFVNWHGIPVGSKTSYRFVGPGGSVIFGSSEHVVSNSNSYYFIYTGLGSSSPLGEWKCQALLNGSPVINKSIIIAKPFVNDTLLLIILLALAWSFYFIVDRLGPVVLSRNL